MISNQTALETYILSSSLPKIKSARNLFFRFPFKIEQKQVLRTRDTLFYNFIDALTHNEAILF
jgi:hypothetical protein